MTGSQIKLLTKMKKLIKEGKKKFISRNDRDYVADLLELGITEEEAWNYILLLNNYYYIPDYRPTYSKNGDGLTFKMKVNDITAYIKIKIEVEANEEKTCCISFHKDNKEDHYEM